MMQSGFNRSLRARAMLLIGTCLASMPAHAQQELDDNRKIEKRKEITQTMTEPVYRRLNAIHEDLAAEKYADALSALDKFQHMRLNKHEEALVAQTYGFAYVQQGKHEQALKYFEQCVALDALPATAQQGLLYSLAGLYAAEGQYLKAIETIREWFRYEADPIADAYMMVASAFTELERYDDALPYVQKAIRKSAEPKENWYLLELAIYFEKRRYRDAIGLLKKIVQIWPDTPKYWDMLASAHLEINEDKQALDTMMVAYAKGMIDTERKIVALAQLNIVLDIPYTAGVILEKAIQQEKVKASKENLDILLQAWISSNAYDNAVRTIDRLAPLAKDGSYYMQKASIYNELGEWKNVAEAVDQALKMGVDKPTDAYMLAGMALTELEDYEKAVAAFRDAKRYGDAKQRQNADAWIEFVEDRTQARRAALR